MLIYISERIKKQFSRWIIFIFLWVGIIQVQAENSKPGACHSYQRQGNKVIFNCENNIQVEVENISSGILRIWFDTDGFTRNNESFAVVKKGDENSTINVSEQPGSYEIYTGDLIVRIEKSPFQIRVFDKYQKLLMEDFQERGFVADSTEISSFKTLKPNERIYGLGEKTGLLDRVGSRFKM
ncbi:MAG TPA: DUF4968 domain-containing protein, partial [Bacteroidales bacterium]|nr:DUF4968 domain-containing protein [Bacteroidales bacterium]